MKRPKKTYDINLPLVNQIISKVQRQKSPRSDIIISFWYKTLFFNHRKHTELYQQTYRTKLPLSRWLTLAGIYLLPKNTETELYKNYTPIACLNLMYKIYTSGLNSFLFDHWHCHKIIPLKQAVGTKGYVYGQNSCWLVNQLCQKWKKWDKKSHNNMTWS